MLGFSQVLKPIKWQDLIQEGKNGHNGFQTGAKIHFSKKKYFGVSGTLSSTLLSTRFHSRVMGNINVRIIMMMIMMNKTQPT